jgi:hypothetical protein
MKLGVIMAMGWMIGVQGLIPDGGGNFSLLHCIQTGPGIHPATYSMSTGGFSLGLKRPGREADHSNPSSAKVKNVWHYTSTPHYIYMMWCLINHRDNFTFTFTFNF